MGPETQRRFRFPEQWALHFEELRRQFSLSPREIADAVLEISNAYQSDDPKTKKAAYQTPHVQAAYLFYFFPLNYLRVTAAIQEGQKLGFFQGINSWTDWGSGPGTASLALCQQTEVKRGVQFEELEWAVQFHKNFHALAQLKADVEWRKSPTHTLINNEQSDLLVLSYSRNEARHDQFDFSQYSNVMILEPSTHQLSRSLMQLRQALIKSGLQVWAPCVHQLQCPLLNESKTDWCYDRIFVELPEFYQEIEELLPMKNRSITFSYLLASRRPRPTRQNEARIIGDTLYERGKVKQMICRGDRREFLSWLTKNSEPQQLAHGDLIQIPEDIDIKGNELRPKVRI